MAADFESSLRAMYRQRGQIPRDAILIPDAVPATTAATGRAS